MAPRLIRSPACAPDRLGAGQPGGGAFLPALWPALGFAGLYLGLALLGFYAFIPWSVQALLLAATVTAIGLSLDLGFASFAWPRWKDGARRLEENSGLKHRPISEGQDRLIGEDPFALTLWRLHQARSHRVGQIARRVGPRPIWPAAIRTICAMRCCCCWRAHWCWRASTGKTGWRGVSTAARGWR